jgi:hypothetical protein
MVLPRVMPWRVGPISNGIRSIDIKNGGAQHALPASFHEKYNVEFTAPLIMNECQLWCRSNRAKAWLNIDNMLSIV